MHPKDPDLHFSHETIYQAIYAMPRGDLRAEVVALLRQTLPMGEELSVHSQNGLDAIARAPITRPRKSLGWKCPADVFLPKFDYMTCWHRTCNPVALHP